MRRFLVAAFVLVLSAACSTPTETTTTTAAPATSDRHFDTIEFAPPTTRPRPTTTAFVPLVESPLTADEIAFLNAWAVIYAHPERFHPDGVDMDGDGRIDRGWHELEVVGPYLDRVDNSSIACNRDDAQHWVESGVGRQERESREQYVLLVRSWLC